MKNHLYKAALVAALGVAGATAAQATSPNNGDLVIGFTSTSSTVTEDYFVDLGPYSSLTVNDNLSADLSLSTLQSVFGSALTSGNVDVGVIGADTVNNLEWDSSLRNSGPFTPPYTSANSTKPASPTSGQFSLAGSDFLGLDVASGPQGETKTDTTSWSYIISQGPGAKGTAAGEGSEGVNSWGGQMTSPSGAVASDGKGGYDINLDLYGDNNNSGTTGRAFTYDGYFNLDINGSSLSFTYDPTAAVPEPATYGLFAGAGLLLVALRRQFIAKNA